MDRFLKFLSDEKALRALLSIDDICLIAFDLQTDKSVGFIDLKNSERINLETDSVIECIKSGSEKSRFILIRNSDENQIVLVPKTNLIAVYYEDSQNQTIIYIRDYPKAFIVEGKVTIN